MAYSVDARKMVLEYCDNGHTGEGYFPLTTLFMLMKVV